MKKFPNILIVRGTGRNVGKTISVCKIIEQLANENAPIGIKISAHFHELENPGFLYRSEEFEIVEEKRISDKDSSRMLQAGAEKVFYVQSENPNLAKAFETLLSHVDPLKPVIVESGGLYDVVEPGILVHVFSENGKTTTEIRPESNVIKVSREEAIDFDWDFLQFKNGKFV